MTVKPGLQLDHFLGQEYLQQGQDNTRKPLLPALKAHSSLPVAPG